jgi:propionyl-CoA carboxylase alpha chain
MNTRLQVEHPVTELVTGIDLVEQMIRVATGEKLAIKQADVKLKGWAVESRIYAEDPYRGFLPSIGRLVRYRPPGEGVNAGVTVRNDTGVEEGGEISMYYDPLIAKLVTHAASREAAIEAQSEALDAFAVEGIQHNIPFLAAIMQNPRWRKGDLSTGFIAEEFPDGFQPPEPKGRMRDTIVAVAAAIDHLSNARRRQITHQMQGQNVKFSETRVIAVAGTVERLRVEGDMSGPVSITYLDDAGGTRRLIATISDWWPGQPVWHGEVGGEAVAVRVRPILNGVKLSFRGHEAEVQVLTPREAELAALMPRKVLPDTSRLLLCPMPGLVKSISVAVGQDIKAGDTLCVVEAMKMENVLRAERDGIVTEIRAKPGDSLAVDAVIMTFG